MEHSETGSIKVNIFFNICRTLMNVAYPVITFSYVARVLSIDDMGSVAFSRNYVSYFSLLALLGVSYYGVREGARLAKDREKLCKFFWEINIINLIATIVAFLLFGISVLVVKKFSSYRILLLISSIGIVLNGLSNEWVLTSLEEYRYLAIRSFIIQLGCILLILVLVRLREDYIKYCAILLLSSSGSTLFNWLYVIKAKLIKRIPISDIQIKKHLKPILILFAMLVSIDLYTMLDTTMLGFMKGDYEVGVYNAAIKIPRLVNSIIASVGAVLVPKLSYYYDVDKDRFLNLINKAQGFIMFITVPCFMGVLMMANEIVTVFAGGKYGNAFMTTRLLAPLTLIIPVSVLFNNQIFIPMRKEILVLKSTCIGALVNLLLNGMLIPYFAQNGAAVASVAAEFSVMTVCLYHVKKELNIHFELKKYARSWITSICIIVLCIMAKMIFPNVYLRLAFAVMICGFTYALANIDMMKYFVSINREN